MGLLSAHFVIQVIDFGLSGHLSLFISRLNLPFSLSITKLLLEASARNEKLHGHPPRSRSMGASMHLSAYMHARGLTISKYL